MERMIKYRASYLLCGLLFAAHCVLAQTSPPANPNTVTRTYVRTGSSSPLDTNKLVYDDKGNALRYYQYQKLINTGEYAITSNGPPGQAGTKQSLKKLSQTEQYQRFARNRPSMVNPSPMLQENKELDINPLLDIVSKEELDNKVIVMIFWSPDCPPCTESFESINELFMQIHNPENVVIMAITNDTEGKATATLIKKPLMYARLISNARKISQAYQEKLMPAYVVTDKNHIIRFSLKGIGTGTINEFKNCIRTVLYE